MCVFRGIKHEILFFTSSFAHFYIKAFVLCWPSGADLDAFSFNSTVMKTHFSFLIPKILNNNILSNKNNLIIHKFHQLDYKFNFRPLISVFFCGRNKMVSLWLRRDFTASLKKRKKTDRQAGRHL